MSLCQSTVALFYVILFVLSLCTFTFAASKETRGVHSTDNAKVYSYPNYFTSALLQLGETMDIIVGEQKKHRVKRSESKFSDAAGMSQMKLLQLFIALISNMMTDDPVGAQHPLSRKVPHAFVKLIKEKLATMFAPELEDRHDDLD